jgi:hypothetical protein
MLYNGERHGTEKQHKQTKRLEQLGRDLHAICQLQTDVLASDRNLFNAPPPSSTFSLRCCLGLSSWYPGWKRMSTDKMSTQLCEEDEDVDDDQTTW